ncbi:4-alpha-L-fucosyltransferase glycosyl transferase group 56 [Chitinophaga eiseniae]|uniref:4-alpha-L-fucosyltransferase glycosyl transferase group 56 n=2 Tax=Chitinophaga eiseniae TaxID=634771 RepID=A0A1T4RWV0_9BACT|nr:4-alpha-L-fucosyltransferase glycosyl transferase group 56 [Chitinophaga eiseniae]
MFLISTVDPQATLRHTEARHEVKVLKRRTKQYISFIRQYPFDVLVVHAMCRDKRWAVNRLVKGNRRIIWLSWGTDIYNTSFYKKPLYQYYTNQIVGQQRSGVTAGIKSLLSRLYYFSYTGMFPDAAYKKAVAQVDYCATVIPDEFEILNSFPFFSAKQVLFSYESIENMFKDKIGEDDYVMGNDILVGNSAGPESNHLDVLNAISEMELGEKQKVVVPLNYAGTPAYKAVVLKQGEDLLGENFFPLLDFYPSAAYVTLLKQCSVAVMNHNRQQAVGNLIALLWLGCRIFMSEESIVYSYLKRKGFKIYSFQQEFNGKSIGTALTREEREHNRELLIAEYSHQAVLTKVKMLIAEVEQGVPKYLQET